MEKLNIVEKQRRKLEMIIQAREMRALGLTCREIAEQVQVTSETVRLWTKGIRKGKKSK